MIDIPLGNAYALVRRMEYQSTSFGTVLSVKLRPRV
jgi:hypothetical protein